MHRLCTSAAALAALLTLNTVCTHASPAPTPDLTSCIAAATKIVAQMTLDEKIEQVHGGGNRQILGIPRLNIPTYYLTNGPAGAGPGGVGHQGAATKLPAPIALAATFDLKLAYAYGSICGKEALDYSNNMIEAPCVNIARVPEGGRVFEGYGEDPYLSGQIAVPVIHGIQDQGIDAEIKHFVGNDQETHRNSEDSVIDERTLREIYLPPFEAAVKDGHVDAVMSAYNRFDGTFCSENKVLLTDILRTEWGFQGYTTSDFGAVHSTVPSVMAGLDVEMPTGKWFGDLLSTAVLAGQVPVSRIDQMLIHRYSMMMLRGTFHDPLPNQPIPVEADGAISRQIADAAVVLLKNDSAMLPLNPAKLHSIVLIGTAAVKAKGMGGGSSAVRAAYLVDPLVGVQNAAGSNVTVTVNDGSDPAAAASLAHASDVAVVILRDYESEGADHLITFTDHENALVNTIVAANPKTIIVLQTGSAVILPWIKSVPAVVEAWYPGAENGNVVADILFGAVNPSGKLPLTFPAQVSDQPAQVGTDPEVNYSEGLNEGYRGYDANHIAPLFPFGYGLSYTTFKYSNLKISKAAATSIEFDITNTGSVKGAEVAQVYVGKPVLPDNMPDPPDWLKGFQKVTLNPGKSAHVQIPLDSRAFSYWDVKSHGWKIASGEYRILVGSSSRDIRLTGSVNL